MSDLIEERVGKLAASLTGLGDGMLFVTGENRRYFSGFPSTDGWVIVLSTGEKPILLVDSRYIEAARKHTECDVVLQPAERGFFARFLQERKISSLAVEGGIKASVMNELRLSCPDTQFVLSRQADAVVSALRSVKSAAEIRHIREAQRLTDEAFAYILTYIKPGKTEREIALELEFAMRRKGAQRAAFDTIVVSGPRGSMPHGVPTDAPVRTGELITMDFGAMVDGYCSDMTRTVALGKTNGRSREIYDIVLQAQQAALECIHAGASCAEVDQVARDRIAGAGYGAFFGHALGHGVGLEIHERPTLSPRAEGKLIAGSVVTVEPGIYLPGECGVRIEDFGVVTADGFEDFTRSPKEWVEL